jgi:superfamily I DNA/RNA helicase
MARSEGLNPEQQEAVNHGEGPLLVLAGAGSGKTRVITCRIARLIGRGVDPSRILALSFTNKAAREMEGRVKALVGEKTAEGVTISTFHSLGLKILKAEGKRIGLAHGFSLLSEGERRSMITQLVRDLSLPVDPSLLGETISLWKNDAKTPEEALATESRELRPLAEAYSIYEKLLRAQAAADFDDLLLLPLRILRRYVDAANSWKGRFSHILVDEYQDTNLVQFELLRQLSSAGGNICVVGDDDQAIYGWRGARVELILNFPEHFPGARTIVLDRNYRSTPTILDSANAVVEKLASRHPKKLRAEGKKGELLGFIEAEDESDEAERVVSAILADRFRRGRPWSHYAVLYRTNGQSRPFEMALRAQNLPHTVVGGTRFFDRKEVRDLISYLKVMNNLSDDASLLRIANVPRRGLGHQTLLSIGEKAKAAGKPFFYVLSQEAGSIANGPARNGALSLLDLVNRWRARFQNEGLTPDNLTQFISEARFREEIAASYESPRAIELRTALLMEMVEAVAACGKGKGKLQIGAFLESVTLDPPNNREDEETDGITLMTLHSAKGLEFPVVFLCGMEEGLLPMNPDRSGPESIDEERRLCYVGMTRAKEKLYLSRALSRNRRGSKKRAEPSRYLQDVPVELTERGGAQPERSEEENARMARNFFAEMMKKLEE